MFDKVYLCVLLSRRVSWKNILLWCLLLILINNKMNYPLTNVCGNVCSSCAEILVRVPEVELYLFRYLESVEQTGNVSCLENDYSQFDGMQMILNIYMCVR